MANMDLDQAGLPEEVNGRPDTEDVHGRTIMHVAIRCLRPNMTNITGLEDRMVELCQEGFGLPIGVGWWVGDHGALDTVAIPRHWSDAEWRRFVQTNWPRVIDFELMRENRGGRLRQTRPETVNTQQAEVLYVLPTNVRLHEEGAFVTDGVRSGTGFQRLVRDVFYSLDPLDAELWANWYWADGNLWIRTNDAKFVKVKKHDWYISDGEVIFKRKQMIVYGVATEGELEEHEREDSVIGDTEHGPSERGQTVTGEMVALDIPRMWEQTIAITFYGATFPTVTHSFRRNERIKAIKGFVRSLQGARAAFELYRTQKPLITNETESNTLIGICFQEDLEVHVMWGKNSNRQETLTQRNIRGLYRDISHAMVPLANYTNQMDFFLAEPWEGFQARNRFTFRVSPSLVVTLKTRTDSGEVVDIGGYDYGGPSRAAMARLMEGVNDLTVMKGRRGDKILQFNLEEYNAGIYGDIGEGVALALACGGSTPVFMGPVMSRIITDGYQSAVQTLDRKDCLEREYITLEVSSQIEKIELATLDTIAEVVDGCALLSGWGVVDVPNNEREIQGLAKWVLYTEVVGRHHLAYEQMISGMGRVHPMITRTAANKAGFRALCETGNFITLDDFITRCEFHGPFHEGGTNEGTLQEMRMAHGWLRRYVADLAANKIEGVTVADLHEAITGQPKLVTTGQEEDMLLNIGTQLNYEEGGDTTAPRRLTKFVTCGMLMLIQLPCSSYEQFRERTTEAIQLSSPLMIIDRADRVFGGARNEE